MSVCPKCDGYGVVPVKGIAVKCDHPDCRGYVSHAEAMNDLRAGRVAERKNP